MIRFGVIGAGRIAHAFSKAAKESGITLEAVASRNLDNALDFKNEYGFKKAYGSYEELLKDDAVDAIYLATPHGLHYEQMLEILKYKKHILCEKAFTLSKRQAQHIFTVANEQGVYVMEAMWTRFLPIIQEIKKALKTYKLGKIEKMDIKFTFESTFDPENRLYNKRLGGGALLDIGIYPITFANIFLGKPEKITSTAMLAPTQVDSDVRIIYHYPKQVAYLEASILKNKGRDAFIYCQKGMIRIPNFWSAYEAYIYQLNGNLVKHIKTPHHINGYEYEILQFVEAIENKTFTNVFMKNEDTLEILDQMDQIRKQIGVTYPNEGLIHT